MRTMALFTDEEIEAQRRAVRTFVTAHKRSPSMAETFAALGWDYRAFKAEFESVSKDPDPLKWKWRDKKRK
jgi:hypothetical protein